ncbi:MAG: response regulator, partial [Bacteroides sp.]|nr:response regulator [Bacteroides sp.]
MKDKNLYSPDHPFLRCLVVDDELIAIKHMVNNIGKLNFLKVEHTCSSAFQAAEVLKKEKIDLMFLDINIPGLSGLEFLESLENPPLTIFTTAYSEYALDGFRL